MTEKSEPGGGSPLPPTPLALLPLLGARIRRIDVPEPDLVTLTLALDLPGEPSPGPPSDDEALPAGSPGPAARRVEVLLVSVAARAYGVGLVLARPHGAPASAFCQLLRRHLENAVIAGAELEGDTLRLRTRRGPTRADLVLARGALTLEAEGRAHALPRGAWRSVTGRPIGATSTSLAHLRDAGVLLTARRRGMAERDEAEDLGRELAQLVRKLEKRAAAVEADLARSDEVPLLRARGSLVLSSLGAIPRGAARVTLLDTSESPPCERTVELDPARDPRDLARSWFERARKLERGEAIARQRLDATRAVLSESRALAAALASTPDESARERARTLLAAHSPRPPRSSGEGKPSARQETRLPYRRIAGHAGREIRVGRGARDNDELTQRHAAPHDLWLHARGVPGSHVVVPLARGETCPPELLIDAATLAAHYSDRKTERVVEVDHLPRGRVRKRRGMAPGMVEVDHPKTIAVRIEPDRLSRLLGKPG